MLKTTMAPIRGSIACDTNEETSVYSPRNILNILKTVF